MKACFDKKAKSLVAIYAIIAIVFTLLFFVIPFRKTAASYICFAFTIISIAGSLGVWFLALKSENKDLKSKIYGYPIIKVGFIYMIIQAIVCVVICIISAFVVVPYWIAVLLSLLLLALAAIGVILTENARDFVEDIEKTEEISTKNISIFNVDIAGIIASCATAECKSKLEKLEDEFKYSDPVSSEATFEIENKIKEELESLKNAVTNSNEEEIDKQVQKVKAALAERNGICKANKKGY